MKNYIFFLLIFFTIFTQSQVRKDFVVPKKAKIGLSLSGGGAKGFAHVGILKVLDSLGIKVDYIAGTSMGATVGSLYASGYTGKDIEKIVLDTDFYSLIGNEKNRKESSFFSKSVDKYLLTIPVKNGKINVLPKAISGGQKTFFLLKELLKNVSYINDFSKLPIPFFCVATNLESGNMTILDKGDLPQSVLASSAYPSLIDPVKIGDSIYIDGAMTVNYPSKPLKERGVNIVIGVDLNQGLAKRDKLSTAIDILNQVSDFETVKNTKDQIKYTDINIHPNLDGLSATNYDNKKAILNSGYSEALKYVEILKLLPKRENTLLRVPVSPIYSNVYKIDSLVLENGNIFGKNYVEGKMGMKTPSMQTYGSINKMLDKLYATNNYTRINYDLLQKDNKNILKLNVTEDDTRFFLKFGLHYDEVFKTGLLLNLSAKRLLFRNSNISLDVVVGDKPRYYFNYLIDNGYIPGFGLYASGMSFDLKDRESTTFEHWNWYRNEAFIESIWNDKYAIGGGLSQDIFEVTTISSATLDKMKFLNPFFFIKSDTQDDKDFATKGFYLSSDGKILDLFNGDVKKKIIHTKANIKYNIPINSWLTYQINLFGGINIGEVTPKYYQYRPGGLFEQNLGSFVGFTGYEFGNISTNNLLLASNNFQFKLKKNIFIIGNFTMINAFYAIKTLDVFNLTTSSVGLTLGYRSPFGQIKLNASQTLNKNKPIFNVVLGHWF